MSTARSGATQGELHEQFARIGRAVGCVSRVQLLELLCQGERTVGLLARSTGMSVTNTSQHLHVLKGARLVATRRQGPRVYYRAADEHVCRFTTELGAVARHRLLEVAEIARERFDDEDAFQPISRTELLARLARRDVVVVDLRPTEEYRAGHIPGALSLPVPELERRIRRLRKDSLVVAYCRGPYCLLAPQAIPILRAHGYQVKRLEDGFPEWRAAGYPISVGASS